MKKNICHSNEIVEELIQLRSRKNTELLPAYKNLSSEALRYKSLSEYYADKLEESFNIQDYFSKESVEIRELYLNASYYSMENKFTDAVKGGLIKAIELAKRMWRAFIEFMKKIGRAMMNFIKMITTAIRNKLINSQSEFYEKYKNQISKIKSDQTVRITKFRDDFIDQFYQLCDTMEKSSVVKILDKFEEALKEFIGLYKKFIVEKEYRNSFQDQGEQQVRQIKIDMQEINKNKALDLFNHFKEKFSIVDLLNEFSTFLTYVDIKDNKDNQNLIKKIDEGINVKFFGQIRVPELSEVKISSVLTEKNLLCMEKTYIDKANLLVKNLNKVSIVIGSLVSLLQVVDKLTDILHRQTLEVVKNVAKMKFEKEFDNETIQKFIQWIKEFIHICSNVITGCKEYSRKSLTIALLFRNQVYQCMKKAVDKNVEYEEVTEKKERRKEMFKDLPQKIGKKIKDTIHEGAHENNKNVKMML